MRSGGAVPRGSDGSKTNGGDKGLNGGAYGKFRGGVQEIRIFS